MRNIIIITFLLCFHKASTQLYFPPITGDEWATTAPSSLSYCDNGINNLYGFLAEKETKAFILLKDGKIVLEKYFNTFTKDSVWYWASAGKSLTSFLTGMAQEKGLLKISDQTSKYLGSSWTSLTPAQEDKITIWHQLSMTTGFNDDVPDDNCMKPSCLTFKGDAGTRWAYHNAPYRLIHDVIAKSWGNSFQNFMNTQLSTKTGILGFWNSGIMYSKPRSMARYGLLALNNGVWNGQKILGDANYLKSMTKPSQQINKAYGLLWWLNGQTSFMLPSSQIVFPSTLIPNAPNNTWCALGKNDQKIYIVPSQNLVIIRMGNDGGEITVAVSSFDNLLWDKINGLICTSTAEEIQEKDWYVYPNPAVSSLDIIGVDDISQYETILFDSLGNVIPYSNGDVSHLSAGQYVLKIKHHKSGVEKSVKFVKI